VILLDAILCSFRFWRRLRGGVWIAWMTDGGGTLWDHTTELVLTTRPDGARGGPHVEDYRRR
jgi:hypothetical protein